MSAPTDPVAFRSSRPAAAAVAWPWKSGVGASPAEQAGRLRREGVVRGVVGLAIGTALYFWKPLLAYVAWPLSGFVLLAALASPQGLYAAIGKGLAAFGQWVGRVLAVILLSPVFFLIFTVFGRLTRSGRRDKLERWFDRQASTYWHPRHDAPRSRASYQKAF